VIAIGMLALWLAGVALAADPVLTLSGSADKPLAAPRVAFNTADGLFLAVYEFHYGTADWDIDGRLVDPNGQLVGNGLAVAWKGTVEQQEPDVAYNPVTNEFLVPYVVKPSKETTKISACIVAGDGTPGPFVAIAADASCDEYNPAVACDPTTGHYLVVYERVANADRREVWAQLVLATGICLDDPYRLSNPDVDSRECAVACAGGQFLVVWSERQTSGKSRILGRAIQCGYPGKTTFTLAQARDSIEPQVAYNPARAEYLVVYRTRTSATARWFIEGTRINTIGEIKGSGTIAAPADMHCKVPDVACIPADGQYVVTWAQSVLDNPCPLASHQIMAQDVDGGGLPVGAPQPVSAAAKDQATELGVPAPAIAAGICGKALIVWEDQRLAVSPPDPPTTIYSILGTHGAWDSLCCDPNCNSVE
jgi:hypothetical protein